MLYFNQSRCLLLVVTQGVERCRSFRYTLHTSPQATLAGCRRCRKEFGITDMYKKSLTQHIPFTSVDTTVDIVYGSCAPLQAALCPSVDM